MDYNKMSDFEINRLVAIAEGHKCYYGDGSYTNDGVNVTVKGNRRIGWFNPCREGDTAWPIIQKNGISINHYNGVWEASFEWDAPVGAFGTDETVTTSTEHKNPLRAAMVAYLMMREVSDVQGNPA